MIIVDDASKEQETIDYLAELEARESSRVLVLRHSKNQGYVGAVNYGLSKTTAEFAVVMNNDTIAYPGWLSEMILVARQDSNIGLVDPQCNLPKYFRGSREQYASQCRRTASGQFIEIDWARGFCYLIKRRVIDQIGALDWDFAPAYYDDWDYSVRAIKAGFRCVRALGSFVRHFTNVTYSACDEGRLVSALMKEKGEIFYKRWGRPLKILAIDSGFGHADLEVRLSDWLRDQNKVILFSAAKFQIRHVNLKIVAVPQYFLSIMAFFFLLDNLRHSSVKRVDLVIADIKGIWKNILLKHRIEWVDIKDQQSVEKTIRKLKFFRYL